MTLPRPIRSRYNAGLSQNLQQTHISMLIIYHTTLQVIKKEVYVLELSNYGKFEYIILVSVHFLHRDVRLGGKVLFLCITKT